MILADASSWIEYLHGRFPELGEALAQEQVLMHPWVLGEVSLGTLSNRHQTLTEMGTISAAPVIADGLIHQLIEDQSLDGTGIGWVDCQLLASAKAMEVNLWTHDKALKRAWEKVRRSPFDFVAS